MGESEDFGCVPPRESDVDEGPCGVSGRRCRLCFGASGAISTTESAVGCTTRLGWQLDLELDNDVAAIDMRITLACIQTLDL